MIHTVLNWTHTGVSIDDIRKLYSMYAIHVNIPEIKNQPLFISERIFEERILSYFLVNNIEKITRDQILAVKWNMFISKGYYIKVDEQGRTTEHRKTGDEEKFFVSFLEIDGELGTFHTNLKIKKEKE
jgi:hypothetical protein